MTSTTQQGDHSPPDWFGLLRYQRSRGRTGLTIPVLVGATHKPTTYEPIEEGAAFTELTSLLVSFRDVTPHSHCVVMAECVDLLEPIAALYPPIGRADCDPVPDPSSRTTRLYVQSRYFRGARRTSSQ